MSYAYIVLHQANDFYNNTGYPVECDADAQAATVITERDAE